MVPKIARLGRPQFATDISGAVVWDMGEGVTPFGDSVNLAGAFAQRLMFPGQYADVETGDDTTTLSHNWHRTYDPTLGRYLQSDPIGLAGGLNRYAYVGGNPVGYVDPMGLCSCGSNTEVSNIAKSHNGSTEWSYYISRGRFKQGSNKCNQFVEDVLVSAGSTVPDQNGYFSYNGPTAGQWGDPSVNIPGYPVVHNPQPGDIVAIKQKFSDATGHVGIVTGAGQTASQSSKTDTVVINDWGFRKGQKPTFRRCTCKSPSQNSFPTLESIR